VSPDPRPYDVILFDSIGMPYTGSTPEHSGLGGSEFESILLAEGLARRGFRVLVLNQTLLPATEGGVEYANHEAALSIAFACRVLILARYSQVPPVRFGRLVVAVSDMAGKSHGHLEPYFAGVADATLVALSTWHRSLFPATWRAAVIPYILPERVYSYEAKVNPHRFVYASAALKGLRETLAIWQELKRDPALADAELVVCTPGYDAVDEGALARAGVRFLGSLPFDKVVHEIASSAGMFYVNTFPETFCIVAALAEALGRRVHVLCVKGAGALHETVRSPLVTASRDEFVASFRAAYALPDDPRWYAAARDYHETTVMAEWLRVLGLDAPRAAERPPSPSGAPSGTPTVCLNMIVKDEAHVIERCLASVKAILSHWVIVDTGSTDGTEGVIRRCLEGIPGELHKRAWKDFATNRNEAIELARGKADYLLVMDADDVIEVSPGFTPGALTLDSYEVRIEDAGNTYYRPQVFRSDLDYRYLGVVHEALRSSGPRTSGRIEGLVYKRLGGGARSADPEKYRKDALILEEALAAEPHNSRYAFYLAQSWRDAGEPDKAVAAYQRRVAMGGWEEETWAALLAIAQQLEHMDRGDDAIIAAYLRTYEYRPLRAEALCYVAKFCRMKNRLPLAHVFASAAIAIPKPTGESMWVDESVYTWRSWDEYAISAYYVGRHEEAIAANERLLAGPDLPGEERERVRKNMGFSTAALGMRQGPR
jgi:tetratricopeptide (TPR) repeat protein